MIYGYARCSTTETKQDIGRQVRELKAMGAEEIYLEYESGTKLNRPELAKVLRHLEAGDTLVCTEISRITRSTKQLCEIVEMAVEVGILLIIGSFKVDCRHELDAMTDGMLKMMGVFSEMERNMTAERIRSGLRHARAKGTRLGRPPLTAENIPAPVLHHFPLYREKRITKTEYARLCGVSRQSIYKYIALMTDMS
jgi:DNA invertase Pin-like site-specific DNA recombinase